MTGSHPGIVKRFSCSLDCLVGWQEERKRHAGGLAGSEAGTSVL